MAEGRGSARTLRGTGSRAPAHGPTGSASSFTLFFVSSATAGVGWRPMGPEGGGCKELPSGGVPWAANTVILALAEREDIMVAWGNRVGVSEIARPCRPGQVHGVVRAPPERVIQPGGGPDAMLQDGHRPRQEPAQGAAVPPSPCWPIPGAWSWWPG